MDNKDNKKPKNKFSPLEVEKIKAEKKGKMDKIQKKK